ncbi:O-antigen polymerase [Novosphingobium aromaticivorans DSM 12444]|uniref:O-antigen polymerase n=1 Tax=Novosphingobium aromaticivorans (strain ATCC 700278 / DSM 12444 / CCUG 56034 / CIP 105152 / NBRC 16084 / F199) TaxID=279238 RepID=Q2G391_NOVAD|nr:O-antigen ligase family protein [Novosphingobium aromaticivorans]ABD27682.1 O-antigen polymerase [Novosphingobium aromaticivorans DSM 12444]SCY30586.1 O-antigen ligase [Novosphingobium aromaticivorans]
MFKTRPNQLGALLLVACLFGGGGVAYGLANLVVQLAAILLLALHRAELGKFLARSPRMLAGLVVLTLALPLVQLLPLPPAAWTTLPGRDFVNEALAVADGATTASGWFPFTVSSARTLVAFLGLLAPFAVIVLAWRLDEAATVRIMHLVVMIGLANVLLGVVQVLGQGGSGQLYIENEMPGVLFGFFANRNSTGVFLVCCLLVLAALPAARPLSGIWLTKAGAALLLATGVFLTQSRTSMVLLGLPAAFAVLRIGAMALDRRVGGSGRNAARTALGGALVALALGATLTVAGGGSRIDTALARFERSEEQRPAIWEDTRYAIERYWPVGAGMGTFDEVFQIDESLENITPRRAGRAHNDYLEIAVEAGVVGLAVVALWAIWAAFASWRAASTPQRWPALAGTGILMAVALQSLLDYPLRNQAMLCIAALAVALLTRAGRSDASGHVAGGAGR